MSNGVGKNRRSVWGSAFATLESFPAWIQFLSWLAMFGILASPCLCVWGVSRLPQPPPGVDASGAQVDAVVRDVEQLPMPVVDVPVAPAINGVDAGAVAPVAASLDAAVVLDTPRAADRVDAGPSTLEASRAAVAAAVAKAAEEPQRDADLEVIYDEELGAAEVQLAAVPPNDREALGREYSRAVRAVERRRRGFRRRLERARRQQVEERALIETCGGEQPVLGPWDGELVGSENYLRRSAHDPDSIDVERCTPPVLVNRVQCWVTRCQVRGRNAFGAQVLNIVEFSVGRDNRILGDRTLR